MLTFPFYRPGRKAKHLKMPLLVSCATRTPLRRQRPAVKAAEQAPRAELHITLAAISNLFGPASQGRSGGVPSADSARSVPVIAGTPNS